MKLTKEQMELHGKILVWAYMERAVSGLELSRNPELLREIERLEEKGLINRGPFVNGDAQILKLVNG